MSGDDNIIELERARAERSAAEPPVLVQRRDRNARYCTHRRSAVDTNRRVVWCRDCQAELDPLDVILGLARSSDFTHAQQAKRQLERECEELKQERQRLRNAVNRLRRESAR